MPKINFDKFPCPMGNNHRVFAPYNIEKNTKLTKFLNKDTVGALNNYAEHENINIHFKPLENDKHGNLGKFMQEFYTNVANTVKDLKNNK